jgi:hypothetical protein
LAWLAKPCLCNSFKGLEKILSLGHWSLAFDFFGKAGIVVGVDHGFPNGRIQFPGDNHGEGKARHVPKKPPGKAG